MSQVCPRVAHVPCASPSLALLGVGFSQTVARLVSFTAIMMVLPPLMHAGGSHVSPRRIIELDRYGVNSDAPSQSTPGTGARLVELWYRHDPVVWTPHRGDVSRAVVGAEGRYGRTTLI